MYRIVINGLIDLHITPQRFFLTNNLILTIHFCPSKEEVFKILTGSGRWPETEIEFQTLML